MPGKRSRSRTLKRRRTASRPAPTRSRLPLIIGAAALALALVLGVRPITQIAGADDVAAPPAFSDHADAPARHALEAARAQRATHMRVRLKEHDRRRQAEVATFRQRKRAAQESVPIPDPPELVQAIEAYFPGLHPRLRSGSRP